MPASHHRPMANRPHHRRRLERAGFTLLEVIIAVTIVALLATILVPNLMGRLSVAKSRKAEVEVNSLAQQVRLYMTENSVSRIGDDFELEKLCEGDNPYITNPNNLKDPWGHPYMVVVPPTVNRDFDVVSFGADGQPGGDGENKDIVNGAK